MTSRCSKGGKGERERERERDVTRRKEEKSRAREREREDNKRVGWVVASCFVLFSFAFL